MCGFLDILDTVTINPNIVLSCLTSPPIRQPISHLKYNHPQHVLHAPTSPLYRQLMSPSILILLTVNFQGLYKDFAKKRGTTQAFQTLFQNKSQMSSSTILKTYNEVIDVLLNKTKHAGMVPQS